LSERIIKGSPLPSCQSANMVSRPRRIIPKEFVRVEQPLSDSLSDVDDFSGNEPIDTARKRLTIVTKHDAKGSSTTHTSISQIMEEKAREFETRLQSEKEQAYRNGFDRGRTTGHADKLKDVERIEKAFGEIAAGISASNVDFYRTADNLMARLSLELAESIIGEAATKASQETLEHNLRRCLEVLKGAGRVKVRINPVDYDFARDNGHIIEQASKGSFHFEFEPDPSITPGGCHLESPNGTVDGRIESQFEILKDNFLQLV
jgi:flagellar assembly protein FliH